MDDVIIHFPGPAMAFGAICRQRCMWCGALIQEYDLDNIAMPESNRLPYYQGKPLDFNELSWWKGLVGISGTNPKTLFSVDESDDRKAPERSCMILMPEEITI